MTFIAGGGRVSRVADSVAIFQACAPVAWMWSSTRHCTRLWFLLINSLVVLCWMGRRFGQTVVHSVRRSTLRRNH